MFRNVLFMALVGMFPACSLEDSKVAKGEGEGPVCACASDADCQDGNFCNGVETCNCACSPGTPPDCADEFECTEDRCANNECMNVPAHARCGAGKICRPAEGGCVAPPPCRDDADCVPDDPCQTGACDAATRACTFAPFDGDEDGHAPIVCGGDDCDDSKGMVHPEANESCNEEDDNCDGEVDEGTDFENNNENCGACGNVCAENERCIEGECRGCPRAEELCARWEDINPTYVCIDLQNDPTSCGECGRYCNPGYICTEGACACAPDADHCEFDGEEYCTDFDVDELSCGRCGNECALGAYCRRGQCNCEQSWRGADCNDNCVVCDVSVAGPNTEGYDRVCTHIDNEPYYCGRCENRCGPDQTCNDGRCVMD